MLCWAGCLILSEAVVWYVLAHRLLFSQMISLYSLGFGLVWIANDGGRQEKEEKQEEEEQAE